LIFFLLMEIMPIKELKKISKCYSPLVKRGGIIGFHDIVHCPFVPDCQVEKFWKEIKQKYKTKEVISSAK